MTDLDQLRRTVRVLDLLTESFQAHVRGDDAAFRAANDEANEVDAFAVSGITGGIRIGEIPHPERDLNGWAEYVGAAHNRLADAEAEAEDA
jgi:hypothetical protein